MLAKLFAVGLGACVIAFYGAGLSARGPVDSVSYFEQLANKLRKLQQIPETTRHVVNTILQEHHYAMKSPYTNAALEARQGAAIAAIETLLAKKPSFADARSL